MKRILALRKEIQEGGCYHRVTLPLSGLKNFEVVFCSDISKVNIEDFDIIYNHWTPPFTLKEIANFQSKGIKYIQDIDDWLFLPPQHPYYGKVDYASLLHYACIADAVIVSTNQLKDFFLSWNSNTFVNYNALPYQSNENVVKGKIAIGFCGSPSHYPDLKEIEKDITKILNSPVLQKKCKFVICGYEKSDAVWNKIIKLFKHHKFELELHSSKPVESYLDLYQHINILLAPLQNNDFNRGKSSLKLQEISCYNIPVIGSRLFLEKEASDVLVEDWIKNIYYLIDNLEVGKQQAQNNRLSYEKRVEELEEILLTKLDCNFCPQNLNIFSITYKNEQKPQFKEFRNESKEKLWRFEYNCMLSLERGLTGYIGMLSWRFYEKTGYYANLIYRMIEWNKDYDIYGLAPQYYKGNYLSFTFEHHSGIEEVIRLVCARLGLEVKEPTNVIYSNYFVAKAEIFYQYLDEIITPALDYMEREIWDLTNQDSGYEGNRKDLLQYTGLEYYNMCTFVCERLFSLWIEQKNFKFKQLI